jgi:integrase/recombinase XerD
MPSLDPDLLNSDEIERLIAACSRRAPTGLRNRALLVIGWRAGLRCREATELLRKDLDLEASVVTVRKGKGGRMRRVGLDSGTVAVLERWLAVRQQLHLPPRSPLLCTLQGQPLDPSYVRHLMKRLSRRAGIERRAHYHGLRHAYAVGLANDGAPLPTIQRLLGHANAATTSIYLSRLGADEAVAFASSRDWVPR